jgi:hypothetical protein
MSSCTPSPTYFLLTDENGHQYGPAGPALKKGLNIAKDAHEFIEPDEKLHKYGLGGYYVYVATNVLEDMVHARFLWTVSLSVDTMEDLRMVKLPDGRIRTNTPELDQQYDLHDLSTIQMLKSLGANLRIKQDYLLKWALKNNLLEIAQFLLGEGLQLTSMQIISKIASSKGYVKVLELIRTKESGYSDALDMEAALLNGQLASVLYLEKRGTPIANLNEMFVLACRCGYLDLVTYLWTKSPDINFRFGEPLKMAARYGHLEVVKLLIKCGVNIGIDNSVALRQATIQGHGCVVDELRAADCIEI